MDPGSGAGVTIIIGVAGKNKGPFFFKFP